MRTTRNGLAAVVLVVLGVVLGMFGAATAGADEGDPVPDSLTLTGSAVFEDGAVLPAGALLTVTLEDTSRADAPAVTIGQAQVQLSGQRPPVAFALIYPRSAVLPQAVYAVRGRVTQGDRLLFTTMESNPVDALNPAPIDLRMLQVAPPDSPPTPDVSLTDTYWKVVEVDGAPVDVADGSREPSLVLNGQDGRFAGSGGVNRLMGGYTLDGDLLSFSNTASTMMAGPPAAMRQEQAIIAALQQVRGYRIGGDQLWLADGSGRPVLRAVAVALR